MVNKQNSELTSESEAARFVENDIKAFARTSPINRLPHDQEYIIFDEPLVRFADGDDPLFTEYKAIIAPTHLTPREALAQAYEKDPADLPARLSVISWVLPIQKKTRKANRREKLVPSRLWSHTRWYGEQFNDEMRKHVTGILTGRGYVAVAPMLQPYFKINSDEKGPYSNWSERHIAYVVGHGTFSLSDGFITERGIAHRCGSVVTNLVLPPSPRAANDHYSNCRFYVDGTCGTCITRCPASAISEEGHDKLKCQQYLRDIGYIGMKEYDPATSVAGCGLCQTSVPCEYRIPVKNNKK
jgi:epoxyqueuosine reductase